MSLEIIDVSLVVSTSRKPEEVATQIDKLKGIFELDADLSEINRLTVSESKYYNDRKNDDAGDGFGETDALLYAIKFSAYNTDFSLKVLTFQYETSYEVLKVEIEPENGRYKKELEPCCNTLRRRRNLNLLFKTLIEFSKVLESRRLIVEIILEKCPFVRLQDNADGGVIVMYRNSKMNVRLGIFWSVVCQSDFQINDVIEVYYNDIDLPNLETIRENLIRLTHPQLSFGEKYRAWKNLLEEVSEKPVSIVPTNVAHPFSAFFNFTGFPNPFCNNRYPKHNFVRPDRRGRFRRPASNPWRYSRPPFNFIRFPGGIRPPFGPRHNRHYPNWHGRPKRLAIQSARCEKLNPPNSSEPVERSESTPMTISLIDDADDDVKLTLTKEEDGKTSDVEIMDEIEIENLDRDKKSGCSSEADCVLVVSDNEEGSSRTGKLQKMPVVYVIPD